MNGIRWRLGVTTALAAATGLALWLLAGSAGGEPPRLPEEGTVVAIDTDHGRLVVEDGGDRREILVDLAARIFNERGDPVALDELRAGDRIFYEFEITETTWFVTEIRRRA